MSALQFPCTIFKTQNRMDDYGAEDMRCGDLSEARLKQHYGLNYISDRADPWALVRRSALDNPRSKFCCNMRQAGGKITRQQCAVILFDEFRQLSDQFSLFGPYRYLIEKMITHMQNGKGTPFRDRLLDKALKEHIIKDNSKDNSTRIFLGKTLKEKIDWENKYYPFVEKDELRKTILEGKLPKFDRLKDSFNGMAVSVHDTWATHITMKSLQITDDRFRAVVHYKVQDHFGLDDEDISNGNFRAFNFFRIWFVLQRYTNFAFEPFMTEMEATIEIIRERNAN